ncbi:MAG: hypothetical protein QOK28_27 [Actinomycetota bacterium]|jgi:hypothetical protein
MKFKAVLELHGKTATGMAVPESVIEKLGAGKRPPVVVTINGFSFRTTVAPMGGQYLIGVNADNRAAAGVKAGETLSVTVELDTAPREVEVPKYFAAALKNAGVRAAFDSLSYTHRKEHVRAVEDAKTEATRERRIVKAIQMLQAKS